MSWKLIFVAVALFLISIYAAYRIGGYVTHKADVAQCNTDRANDKATYQAEQTKAEQRARVAQQAADAATLAETQRLLGLAQAQAVQAQKAASEAKSKADTLNHELTRLKNEDPTVQAWSDTCLPPALLRSLHGPTSAAPAGSCH